MTVIGIDLGTTTGWAILNDVGERLDSGHWSLPSGGQTQAHRRFEGLATKLGALLLSAYRGSRGKARIDLAYERPHYFGHLDAALVFGGLEAILLTTCAGHGIEYHPIPVGRVKVTAIGRVRVGKTNRIGEDGKPIKHDPKAGMAEAAQARWPSDRAYQADEIDALFVAEACRLALQGGSLPWDNVIPPPPARKRPAKTRPSGKTAAEALLL